MKLSDLKTAGHWPTLVTAFLYFDYSFMVWTLLGVLANQIAAPESLNLTQQQRFFMVSVPILSGGFIRLLLGLLETFAGGIPGVSNYRDGIAFAILIVVLLVRPAGLLGRVQTEKV